MEHVELALAVHPRVPSEVWEPRCLLCRLARTQPAAYEYSTQALMDGVESQEGIAARLAEEFDFHTTQPQLSRHRRHHLLPAFQRARERFEALVTQLQMRPDIPPLELVKALDEATLIELRGHLEGCEDPAIAARLASSIASLSKAYIAGELAGDEQDKLQLENEVARLKAEVARGDYEAAFVAYVEQHHPELVPALQSRQAPAGEPQGATE